MAEYNEIEAAFYLPDEILSLPWSHACWLATAHRLKPEESMEVEHFLKNGLHLASCQVAPPSTHTLCCSHNGLSTTDPEHTVTCVSKVSLLASPSPHTPCKD